MTIIEAIKSGRPIRRPSWRPHDWLNANMDVKHMLSKEEILADDWEVEEKTVTITKKQLLFAVHACCARGLESVEDIAKELGL